MSDKPEGMLPGLQSLLNKFPIVREQAVMQGFEWASGTGFTWLSQSKPELAAWLHETIKKNTILSRIVLSVIGEVASRVAGLAPSDINNARIADALVAVQNMVRLGEGVSGRSPAGTGLTVFGLQHRLSTLPVETSKPIILRFAAMSPERKQHVLHLIGQFTPDQMVNLLSMDDEVLDAMLSLGDLPIREREQSVEDPFLARLRQLGETLKAKSERPKE